MPELPEVTTTVNGLNKVLLGLYISDVWTDLAKENPIKQFENTIKNKKFFAYINEKNNSQNLSYEHIFNEIDKQISTQFKSIAKNKNIKYKNLICNHIFIEGFNEKTQLEYEICCGS